MSLQWLQKCAGRYYARCRDAKIDAESIGTQKIQKLERTLRRKHRGLNSGRVRDDSLATEARNLPCLGDFLLDLFRLNLLLPFHPLLLLISPDSRLPHVLCV